MRYYKLLTICFLISFTACNDDKKWDKDTLVNECLGNFTKKNEQQKLFTTMEIAHMCDCISDKMLVKYKNSREADKDTEGLQLMGVDCAREAKEKVKF